MIGVAAKHRLESPTALMQNDTLLKQWEDGVLLGSAWWVYADLQKKKRFRELQQIASSADPAPHIGFQHALASTTLADF
jgi:hypothetical protein